MSRVMLNEVKQISSDMKAIAKRSEKGGRITSREEQEVLDQLVVDREELLGDIIFREYGSMH